MITNPFKALSELQNVVIHDLQNEYDDMFMALYHLKKTAKEKAEIRCQLENEQKSEIHSISNIVNSHKDRMSVSLLRQPISEAEIDDHFCTLRSAIKEKLPEGATIGKLKGCFKLTEKGRIDNFLFDILKYQILEKRRKFISRKSLLKAFSIRNMQ